MLPPEIEEGNKEYKRYFKNINKKRFFELSTQMNWRLLEGNGETIYYLGINDDGSIYGKLDNETFKYSINIIKKLAKECDATITNMKEHIVQDLKWFEIKINKNNATILQEYRILLLGDTDTGKSTFLANIIKRKTNENNDANNYIYNHKHELESGNTSSIKYYMLVESDKKYLFFDSPGNSKYIKTLLKIVQSIDYNLVIYFPNKNKKWEYEDILVEYFNILDIPLITFNLNSENNSFPNINLNKLIETDEFLKYIYKESIEIEQNTNDVNFLILNTSYNNEVGWLLSGYLKSGCINVGDVLLLYDNESNIIKVKSIYYSNTEDITVNCKKISSPQIITLCCDIKDSENKQIKYGTISNKLYDLVDTVSIKWNFTNPNINQINCNILNSKLTLEYVDDNKYKIINNKKISHMEKNTIFIDYINKNIGFLQ
jgi:GTPase